jgi:hypothetical protein
MAGEFDDIRARLETIAEELTDLAISRLLDSIDAGGTEFPVDEKRLTRARRSGDTCLSALANTGILPTGSVMSSSKIVAEAKV